MRGSSLLGLLALTLDLCACGEASDRPSSQMDAQVGSDRAETTPIHDAAVDAGDLESDGSAPDAAAPDALALDGAAPAPDAFVPEPEPCTGPGCGPRILSLAANVTTLRSNQQLIVTAVVSDPDGIDDLIGGTLVDPDSGANYGAFQTSASEGAYALTLSWSDLDTVRSIEGPATGVSRALVARFFDAAGNTTEGQLQVNLRCALDDEAPCDGECVNLESSSQHCGACRQPAPSGTSCEAGEPVCWSSSETLCGNECADLSASTLHCGVCGHACPPYPGRSVSCWEDGICSLLDSRTTAVSCNSVCAPNGYTCGWTQWVYGSGGDAVATLGTCGAVPASTDSEGRALTTVNCGCRHYPPANGCALGPEDTVQACTDGCSNDGDRYVDCEDFDCCPVVSCAPGTACGDR